MTLNLKAPCHGSSPVAGRVFSSSSTLTQHRTPTQNLRVGKRWPEYQGSNNWVGLLDPLDDTLRSELLRYGKFVEATYASFNFDPSSPSYGTRRVPACSLLPLSGLPDSGYRVTRDLHVTCGVRLPIPRGAPAWATKRTSWAGYVAVCEDDDEIERLGRRDVVVAYRGTCTCLEWLENLQVGLAHVPAAPDDVMVEAGFWSLYTSAGAHHRSLQEEVRDEIERIIHVYGGDGPMSITITGHSLGAALATLTAYDLAESVSCAPPVTVFSFGGPRVGNERFRREVEERGCRVLRIVNTRDIVTKVPGFGEALEGATWLGWRYSDVGQELRVSCRTSSVAACHDLGLYLKLVKQMTDTCSFSKTERERGPVLASQWSQ